MVKAHPAPKTPEPAFILSSLQKFPPQIRRLMKDGMEIRAGQTPLSPLRRYSGRLHKKNLTSALETGSDGQAEVKGVIPTPANTESLPGSSPIKENITTNLFVNFHHLLRSPKVTRENLTVDDRTSPALFATPSSSKIGGPVQTSIKSIMKVSHLSF